MIASETRTGANVMTGTWAGGPALGRAPVATPQMPRQRSHGGDPTPLGAPGPRLNSGLAATLSGPDVPVVGFGGILGKRELRL